MDKKIIKIVKENPFITHRRLKKIIDDKKLMAQTTFEKRIKYLTEQKIIPYMIIPVRSTSKSRVPNYQKHYSFKTNLIPDVYRSFTARESLKNVDEYINDMREKYDKLPLRSKGLFAASRMMATWAVVFDILKFNIDEKPTKNLNSRLLAKYKKKLREMYDIIREGSDAELIERFVNGKCRSNPNELSQEEYDTYRELSS